MRRIYDRRFGSSECGFRCVDLISNECGAKIGAFEIPPGREISRGEFRTEEAESTTRSELVKLLRIARIARPDGSSSASGDAQKSETIGRAHVGIAISKEATA